MTMSGSETAYWARKKRQNVTAFKALLKDNPVGPFRLPAGCDLVLRARAPIAFNTLGLVAGNREIRVPQMVTGALYRVPYQEARKIVTPQPGFELLLDAGLGNLETLVESVPVTLPDFAFNKSLNVEEQSTEDTVIATLTNYVPGEQITMTPNDGRFVWKGPNLVCGPTVNVRGVVAVTITRSHIDALNAPVVTNTNLTIDKAWLCVADRGHVPTIRPSAATANAVCAETRKRYKLGGKPLEAIKLLWSGYFVDGSVSGGGLEVPCGNNQILDGAAIEPITAGSSAGYVPATFGGQPNGVIVDNIAEYLTDEILPASFGLPYFPAGWEFYVRERKRVLLGQQFIRLGAVHSIPGEDTKISSGAFASQVNATGPLVSRTGGSTQACDHGPFMVIGRAVDQHDWAVVGAGDSLADGYNTSYRNGASNGSEGKAGWFIEGCWNTGGRTIPYFNIGCSSTTVIATVDKPTPETAFVKRQVLMKYATHAVENYGTNDRAIGAPTAYGPQTAEDTFQRRQRLWSKFRAPGSKVRHVTSVDILVRTASTDQWATLAGQTPRTAAFGPGGDFMIPINTMLANAVGTGYLTPTSGKTNALFSFNPYVADGLYSWKSDGTALKYTDDGTHFTDFAGTVVAAGWSAMLAVIAPLPA
jgi:hypothetical protein